MKIYVYSSVLQVGTIDEDGMQSALAAMSLSLTTIAELWHLKYLPSNARVWVNADYPELGMWVLAENSTHVRVHRGLEAGWARITRQSVRIGRTADSVVKRPIATYTISDLLMDDVKSTILIAHSQPGTKVQFNAGSETAYPVNGTVSFDPFTVIDLHRYTPPETATVNPVEAADAMINGVKLMTYGAPDERVNLVRSEIEKFSLEIDEANLSRIYGETEKINKAAKALFSQIYTQLASNFSASG